MRHDTYDLDATNVDWIDAGDTPTQPILTIRYAGSPARLKERLMRSESSLLGAEEIDVTFRFQSPVSDAETHGVLAVSNNVTGDFVCEVGTDAAPIQKFVQAARRYAQATERDTAYAVRFWTDDGLTVAYEKGVLLVYGPNGILLRHDSLIPNGIEI
ncbi:DUF5793 family protein [Halorubrum trueperi]|uniref:DUF5793 family protein n=1 Tax=Halorubrum trueperi TaxID=2004704 RepID=A0ABD5UN66_9EURY